MARVMIVAPHPDDETLGVGGTLLRHIEAGDTVDWLIMTNVLPGQGYSDERIRSRQEEIAQVAALYGFRKTYKLDFKTTALDQVSFGELTSRIGEAFRESQPEIVYLPNRSDIHTDHDVTFRAALSCTKTFRYPSVKRILMYETLSETEFAPALADRAFNPNVFVDITRHFDQKLKAMQIYASEVAAHPFPRSLENLNALAQFRGATAGVRYAEAFMLLKEIVG